MVEYIALFGKYISESYFVVSIMILGYLGCDRDKFARIFVAVCFSVILASFLKSIFKMPLPPGMHEGWGFPSGHLTTSTVLYLSLAWEFRSKLLAIIGLVIISTIYYALLHYEFHYVRDLLGALVTAFAWVAAYYYLLKIWPRKKEYEAFILLGVLGFIMNMYNELPEPWTAPVWRALATIFAFAIGWGILFSNKFKTGDNKIFKILKSLIGLAGAYGIYETFYHIDVILHESSTAFFQFFLISIWVSLFTDQVCKPLNKIFFDERKKNK